MAAHDIGLLLLRVSAGTTLMAHGYPKLFGGAGKQVPAIANRLMGTNYPAAVEQSGPENFSKGLEQMGVPMARYAAYASGLAEFGGGLALTLGLGTRLAAPAVIANMLVAIRKAHWQVGFYGQGGYELAAVLASAAGTLLLTGPGKLSLDALLRRD